MNNFDLTKYLAEGRLYENVLAQKLRDEAKHQTQKWVLLYLTSMLKK